MIIKLEDFAMDNFRFYNPTKVFFGKGTIPNIGKEIADGGYQNVLMLAGSGSIKKNGVYEQAKETLNKNSIKFTEHWGVRPNPTLEHANEGIQKIRENSLQAILAIGGGSVIDEAKSIAAGYYLDNLWDAFEGKAKIEKALPVYTILTLSGTCSEMDAFAVLSNDAEGKKWPVGGDILFPKASVIDPSVQMSLPWEQTANGGIDAMSHTMEFLFLLTDQEITLQLGESIIKTIINSLDRLLINPDDYNARANLAWSATLALNGNMSAGLELGDWATHGIEHGLSAKHVNIAHGAGLGVLFPAWIKYNQNENIDTFNRWARNIWNASTTDEAVDKMKEKYKSWGAPVSLRELGVPRTEIPEIADIVVKKAEPGVLKKLNRQDIINILEIAF